MSERIRLGEVLVRHDETVTRTTTITRPFRITELNPPPGYTKRCLGELGVPPRCAVYGEIDVDWNISVGDVVKEPWRLPFTVTCTIHCYFTLGEWWGERAGEPATASHLYFYPEFWVEYLERSLKVEASAGGTTDPQPGTYRYDAGATVTATATPLSGYGFDRWLLDGSSRYENPITIKMDRDYTLTACFIDVKDVLPPTEAGPSPPQPIPLVAIAGIAAIALLGISIFYITKGR